MKSDYRSKKKVLKQELHEIIDWVCKENGSTPYEEKMNKLKRMKEIAEELIKLDSERKKHI